MARIATPIATFAQRGPGGTPGIAIDFIEVEHAAVLRATRAGAEPRQRPGKVTIDGPTIDIAQRGPGLNPGNASLEHGVCRDCASRHNDPGLTLTQGGPQLA